MSLPTFSLLSLPFNPTPLSSNTSKPKNNSIQKSILVKHASTVFFGLLILYRGIVLNAINTPMIQGLSNLPWWWSWDRSAGRDAETGPVCPSANHRSSSSDPCTIAVNTQNNTHQNTKNIMTSVLLLSTHKAKLHQNTKNFRSVYHCCEHTK